MPDAPPTDARSLVAALKRAGPLDPQVEAAMLDIPRAAFLPNLSPQDAYADQSVPIKIDEDGTVLSSSSQPTMIAIMLEQLQLAPGMNVLEIGTGTGYNAALIKHIIGDEGHLTSVEIDAEVAEMARVNLQKTAMGEVDVVIGDGAQGFGPRASYDRIIATAGIWDVPAVWVRQLKPQGILVAPIWVEGFEVSTALRLQSDGSLYSENNRLCGFIRLRGQAAGPELGMRIGTTGLYIYSSEAIDATALQMLISDDAEDIYLGAPLDPQEYWQGFLPYLVLHVPETFILARYQVAPNTSAYEITGTGFALLAHSTACFVPVHTHGLARSFGGADALLAVQDALTAWEQDGKPQQDRLRLRLVPIAQASAVTHGKIYTRRDHALIASMEIDPR